MKFDFNFSENEDLSFGDILGEIEEVEKKEEDLNLNDVPDLVDEVKEELNDELEKETQSNKEVKSKSTFLDDKKYKKTKTKTYKQKKNEEELSKKTIAKTLQTNDRAYTSPSYPTDEQIKDKFTTSAYYKSIYKEAGIFDKPINNLTMDNLKYIIPTHMEDTLLYRDGFRAKNNLKDLKEEKGYKPIKDALPDRIVGGGEDGIVLTDGIDFNKTYNSETRALITEYYSNEKNIRALKKQLYLLASMYALGGITDAEELKRRVDESRLDNLSHEEMKLEFKKLFAKINEEKHGGARSI